MKETINPEDFGIIGSCQLVIKHVSENRVVEKVVLKNGELFIIPDEYFKNGILNYKIKFREYINNSWHDKVNFFYIWNLADFFSGKSNLTNQKLLNVIQYYYDTEKSGYDHTRHALNTVVKHLENPTNVSNKNIIQYLEAVNNNNFNTPYIWKNINILIKHLLNLKQFLMKNKIINTSFVDIQKANNNTMLYFKEFLLSESEILEIYNLPFADFLAARHYSILEHREKAFKLFNSYLAYDAPIKDILMSLGVYSYHDIDNNKEDPPTISKPTFISERPNDNDGIPIVVSVDVNYLRKYGPQLFVTLLALKKYHFHIHVIGEKELSIAAINEAQQLFENMLKFYNTERTVKWPTFSTEEVPYFVKDHTTFYACSRFIHADSFLEWFNRDILIIDVDFYFTDDIKTMLQIIRRYDVALTITSGTPSFTPWTRVMGGTLFLKYNDNALEFCRYAKNYLLYGLQFNNSWTLDQNALCYANEKVYVNNMNIQLFNIPYNIRPLKQYRIRYYMEERF